MKLRYIFLIILAITILAVLASAVYFSVNTHYETLEKKELNLTEIDGFYSPSADKIFLVRNNSFIEINDSYIGKGYFEKSTIHHERCHQQQSHQKRLYTDHIIGLTLNEIECYIRGWLLL